MYECPACGNGKKISKEKNHHRQSGDSRAHLDSHFPKTKAALCGVPCWPGQGTDDCRALNAFRPEKLQLWGLLKTGVKAEVLPAQHTAVWEASGLAKRRLLQINIWVPTQRQSENIRQCPSSARPETSFATSSRPKKLYKFDMRTFIFPAIRQMSFCLFSFLSGVYTALVLFSTWLKDMFDKERTVPGRALWRSPRQRARLPGSAIAHGRWFWRGTSFLAATVKPPTGPAEDSMGSLTQTLVSSGLGCISPLLKYFLQSCARDRQAALKLCVETQAHAINYSS